MNYREASFWCAMRQHDDEERYAHERVEREREAELDLIAWRLGVLAENITWAAALCQSFSLGAVYMARSVLRPEAPQAFTPGCGRSAP